ncbi:LLM class flavin-dependent oxidoreductase [Glaciihabitans arcticus]|uniref:LLM class flavin-dependent oxidoreductase n=1 Tax=Glaciihabitans arcticus TaxID=2668039 RepID=A0A4Q9GPH8_9MICO|nr:LLM class flavin-dependent oxidoreductase [Glaciihabitans arcticus]TBN56742.1 LLM class flavin-dependent oxidoreductase [Glaciihabitans arcticus]
MLQQRAVGVSLPRDIPANQIVDFCQRAEELGFDELWIVEDLFYRGGIAQAAVALASTSTIHVGIGILPAAARNVAFTALEVATLAELYPGRVTLGIGHGVTEWIKQVGAWPKSPLGLIRETLSAVRALLHGSLVNVTGDYVSLRDARLEFPPAHPPLVLAGVRGPKSLAISGAHADGTALAEPVTPEYLAAVIAQVGATRPHRIVAYSNAVVASSLDAARAIARPYLAHMDSPDVAAHIDPLPFARELRELGTSSSSPAEFAAAMPDEWVDQLAIVGAAADVRARVGVLQDAGASVVVFIITGPDALDALESLGTAL